MSEKNKEKAGLFGGTFDPIHLGHLRAAEEIREDLSLDRIIFIPAAIPPHKDKTHITPSLQRLEMLKLALSDNPLFEICDYELKNRTMSYTVDTLRYLNAEYPDTEYYFILGNELFSEIETWKEYKELFKLSNFVVITRPGYSGESVDKLPLALKNDFGYYKEKENVISYRDQNSKIIAFTKIRGLEISSTEIRHCVAGGKSIKYLVPAAVEEYLLENNIYSREGSR
jgi:nicotinate-nucleotide adenylyltransferase